MSTLERPTGPDTELAVPIMTLSLGVEGPATVIAVCGEVDMSTAHLITELSEDAIDARPARLVLDLSGVTFFSAHGISALLRTQRAAAHAHVQLTLRDAAPCITYLLAVTGTPMSLAETTATSILTSDAVYPTGDLSPHPRLPTADGHGSVHEGRILRQHPR